VSDSHFTELKSVEIIKERLSILETIDPYVGKYFSKEYIRRTVLKQTEDEIEELNKEMEEEAAEAEDIPVEEPVAPPPPPPQQLVVSVKKEEIENEIDDTDQKELSKSMTKFFHTLVEEAKSEGKK
jgi:negative regulator of genetic competence, sporulation and motility